MLPPLGDVTASGGFRAGDKLVETLEGVVVVETARKPGGKKLVQGSP